MQQRRHVLGFYPVLRLVISFSFTSSKMHFTFESIRSKKLEFLLLIFQKLQSSAIQIYLRQNMSQIIPLHNLSVMFKASVRSYMHVLQRKPFIFRICCRYQIASPAANNKKTVKASIMELCNKS